MSVTLAKWSLADYHRMIEAGVLAGRRVELILGEIVEMAPEGPLHSYTSDGIAKYLAELLEGRAYIRDDKPVTLPSDGEPEPDVAIVALPRLRYKESHPGPEDIYWVIEVSNSTVVYDLSTKAKMYATDRVQEYWVLDIAQRQLWVHCAPVDGVYTDKQMLESGTLSPLAFPEIEVSVERLFG
jgi:Uma2 family endonuclease